MTCIHIPELKAILCVAPDPITIRDGDQEWYFDTSYPGFNLLNKHGNPVVRYPGKHSRLWVAEHAWRVQGMRLTEDRVAIWDEPERIPIRGHIITKRQAIHDPSGPDILGYETNWNPKGKPHYGW